MKWKAAGTKPRQVTLFQRRCAHEDESDGLIQKEKGKEETTKIKK